jgi:hypothetical protein
MITLDKRELDELNDYVDFMEDMDNDPTVDWDLVFKENVQLKLRVKTMDIHYHNQAVKEFLVARRWSDIRTGYNF